MELSFSIDCFLFLWQISSSHLIDLFLVVVETTSSLLFATTSSLHLIYLFSCCCRNKFRALWQQFFKHWCYLFGGHDVIRKLQLFLYLHQSILELLDEGQQLFVWFTDCCVSGKKGYFICCGGRQHLPSFLDYKKKPSGFSGMMCAIGMVDAGIICLFFLFRAFLLCFFRAFSRFLVSELSAFSMEKKLPQFDSEFFCFFTIFAWAVSSSL